ncbi:hypothetical protein ABK040_007892 [Willaertia magna]
MSEHHGRVLLLDGAVSTELERAGVKLDPILWGAHLLLLNTEPISKVHLSYLPSLEGFKAYKKEITEEEVGQLLRKSVKLAKEAIEQVNKEGSQKQRYVAASVSSYGASITYLAGSAKEYSGDYFDDSSYLQPLLKENKTVEDLVFESHLNRVKYLLMENPDFLLFETIPALKEVQIICEQVLPVVEVKQTKILFSFSCKDEGHIGHGETIEECCRYINKLGDKVFGLGVNCVMPSQIPPLIEKIHNHLDPTKTIIVYPNSGESYEAKDNSWHSPQEQCSFEHQFVPFIVEWIKQHPNRNIIVGGCCRTNPLEISKLSKSLSNK